MSTQCIIYASTPEELLETNKYQYSYVMVPIDFNEEDKPILRFFPEIGITEIGRTIGTANIILEVNEDDPIRLENLCLEAFAYNVASDDKEILEQIHLECCSIPLGLIETNGCLYIEPTDTFLEFIILNKNIISKDRVSEYKRNFPRLSVYVNEACSKEDVTYLKFCGFDGIITRKQELIQHITSYT